MRVKRQLALGTAAGALCLLVAGCGGQNAEPIAADNISPDMMADDGRMDMNAMDASAMDAGGDESNDVEVHHASEPQEEADYGNEANAAAAEEGMVRAATTDRRPAYAVTPLPPPTTYLPTPLPAPLPPTYFPPTYSPPVIYVPPYLPPPVVDPAPPVRVVPFATR